MLRLPDVKNALTGSSFGIEVPSLPASSGLSEVTGTPTLGSDLTPERLDYYVGITKRKGLARVKVKRGQLRRNQNILKFSGCDCVICNYKNCLIATDRNHAKNLI